jgi:cellobiose phosphorylase
VRAVTRALRFGPHGLPLMGTGDWNDGMNLVGEGGVGESVWLGFFLYDVLMRFGEIAMMHGDAAFAERCTDESVRLQSALEQHGWDGEWYRRAYFDDGTPLGSQASPECAIDSISQSWSVLSGAASVDRRRRAMKALDERLVRREHELIQLLTPPFDTSALNPGYIKGYVPGVRENGGQYTHAGIWAAIAFAALGDHRRAWELYSILNPVNHARDAAAVAIYKVEPYVVAADVYAVAPHVGRGGWTWYTGSAGWMYRLLLESLLGLKREGNCLGFAPCLPAHWDSAEVTYRFHGTSYEITIVLSDRPDPAMLTVDGQEQPHHTIALVDDGLTHHVTLSLPRSVPLSEVEALLA